MIMKYVLYIKQVIRKCD